MPNSSVALPQTCARTRRRMLGRPVGPHLTEARLSHKDPGLPEPRRSLVVSGREPAIRRGKNAPPADEQWHTFIFPAHGKAIARREASSAFFVPSDHAASRARVHSPPATTV